MGVLLIDDRMAGIRSSISYVNITVGLHTAPKSDGLFDSVSGSRPAAAYLQ